jgi:putative peptidoglycan lipid II flippase
MSVLVAFSRASGLLRMFVAFAVLGTTRRSCERASSANLVPTLLFEMLAAGALSATLIPGSVGGASHDMSGLRIAPRSGVGGLGLGLVLVAVLVRHQLAAALLGSVHPGAQPGRQPAGVLLVFPATGARLSRHAVAVAFLHGSYRFGVGHLPAGEQRGADRHHCGVCLASVQPRSIWR